MRMGTNGLLGAYLLILQIGIHTKEGLSTIEGQFSDLQYWKSVGYKIISPKKFLANNPMPEEKPEEKTRKPGVKYTLEDWKKEADACRKRAEYWKDKFHALEKTANSVADSMTEVLKTHEKLQLDLDHTNKNFTILQTANKVLKESNENLRNSNDELLKSSTEAKQELGFAKLKIQDLEKSNVELRGANEALTKDGFKLANEKHEALEELKTVKSHLELRAKGIQALEEDARVNRIEIASLKFDFETKNSELEILEEDYNCLKDVQKYTKVVGWAGWIFFFIALFGLMFFKG